jgi:hypothetical protein
VARTASGDSPRFAATTETSANEGFDVGLHGGESGAGERLVRIAVDFVGAGMHEVHFRPAMTSAAL